MAEQECLCLRDRGGARRHTPVRAGETQRCPERRLPLRSCSLGLGWAERLSQGGESPSGGIRPPPPCLRSVLLVGLCWQPAPLTHTHTHTSDTSVPVPPAPLLTVPSFLCSSPRSVFGGAVSTALSASPLSAPSPPTALPPTFLSPCLSLPLSLCFPIPFCHSSPPQLLLLASPSFFPTPLSAVSWPTLLIPTLLVSLPDPGKPNGNVRVRASLVAPGSPG